ncbi:MAG: CU044_2847 family protein [Pseudonocardiaceae bacterium]
MTELVQFTLRDGGAILVEVDEPTTGIGTVNRRNCDGVVRNLQETFERRMTDVRRAARSALEIFREGLQPDEIEPEEIKLIFGVKLTAEAGAVIARTGVEGHLVVEMKWKNSKSASVAETP